MLRSAALTYVRQNPVILPIYLPSILFAFSQGLLIPVIPLFASSFEISYGLIGLVIAGDALGTLLGDVPAGMMLYRLGSKRAMMIGVAGSALATAALFWSESILAVVILRIISGLAHALFNIARHEYIAASVATDKRGRAIAVFGGVFRMGNLGGPAAGGVLAAMLGLRAVFLINGFLVLAALLLVILFVRKEEKPPDLRPHGAGAQLLATLRSYYRVFMVAGIGQLFAQMIRSGRATIIPLYAADVIGLDVQTIGLIISIAAAVDFFMFLPAGIIMDRYGRKYAIIPSFTIQALGMLLIPLTVSAGGLLAVASLIGFGNGIGSGTMMTLGADLAPGQSRGEFLGVWRLIGDVGSGGGPVIVGAVADLVTLQIAALTMTAAGLAAAGVFARFVPETLKKRKRAG